MIDLTPLTEALGESGASAVGGLIIGLLFGIAAQRSQFCLRAATIEFWRGGLGRESFGPKTAIWLLAFSTALAGVQLLFAFELIDTSAIRQISSAGTLSGAVIGGLMFGAGMVLARGCASRLLVLSATGNLRALIAGLILTVVAQASLSGVLSPLRSVLSGGWIVGPETRNLAALLPDHAGVVAGLILFALALVLAIRNRLSAWVAIAAAGVGGTVAGGWWYTGALASQAFELVPVQSVSFTGPSADTLMALITKPSLPVDFDIGLVPGVFAGALMASLLAGEFRIQSFGEGAGLPRYIAGACLMGFGGMLAGGCAVGAGVTGGALLALTAWVALAAMWFAAGVTDLLVDVRPGLLSGRAPQTA